MSAKVMGWVFDSGPVDQAERFVMLAIADNADDHGVAFPGVALLASKTCMSERNVLRVLSALEVGGWLTIQRRSQRVETQRGKVRMGNTYRLNLARLNPSKNAISTGDNLSPHAIADEANNTLANQPSDKVSPVRRGDKTTRDEVTKTARRSDKSALLIRKNHQEPSGEPSTPLTPASGGTDSRASRHGRFRQPRESVAERANAVRSAVGLAAAPAPRFGQRASGSAEVSSGLATALTEVRLEIVELQGLGPATVTEDLIAEWDAAFGEVEYDSHEVHEGGNESIAVHVTSPAPALTAAAIRKYSARLSRSLRAALGCMAGLTVLSRESVAA